MDSTQPRDTRYWRREHPVTVCYRIDALRLASIARAHPEWTDARVLAHIGLEMF